MSGTAKTSGLQWAMSARVQALWDELFRASGAGALGLSEADFAAILAEVGAKHLPSSAGEAEAVEFYRRLRTDELALARACAAGVERAWEVFLGRYREKLYDAAQGIAREESRARELADSLYADLYGTRSRDGQRVSKLSYYTGRGSLEGWLRTVLAQEYVNKYRRERREVSLEEKVEAGAQFAAADPPADAVADSRLAQATDEVLGALPAEERFVLAAYFLDGRTLAEIGRTLSVHESTISRRLERMTVALRTAILDGLVRRGMDRAEAVQALETDVRDLQIDIRRRLSQEDAPATFSSKSGKTP